MLAPFLVVQRSNNQVTSLALSVNDGNQNVNSWCPVDTYFLGIRGWGKGHRVGQALCWLLYHIQGT